MNNYAILPEIAGMNEVEVRMIKKSWASIRSIDPAIVGDLFYSKLFTDHPSLRKMFPKKMDEQYAKLIEMLNIIVARLDNVEQMIESIAAMGRRHVNYGVRPAHYKMVGNALLWTLRHGLGNDWNPDLEKAWARCYLMISDTMINAAKEKAI